MIRFVNIEAHGMHYDNYILIESVSDLDAYYEYRKQSVYNAFDDLSGRQKTGRSKLAGLASISVYPIAYLANLIGNVYADQLNKIINGVKLGISAITGGYMPLPEDCVISNIETDNELFKPISLG